MWCRDYRNASGPIGALRAGIVVRSDRSGAVNSQVALDACRYPRNEVERGLPRLRDIRVLSKWLAQATLLEGYAKTFARFN